MPRRYGKSKRKSYAKRRRRPRKDVITRGLTIPITNRTRMRYADSITLNVGVVGVPSLYAFRCNSIFDPDRSGGGHQPMFHDQYLNWYNHYVVLGSKITVQAVNSNDATQVAQILGIMVNDDTITPTTYSELMEQPGQKNGKGSTKWKIIAPNTNGGKVEQYFSSKKFFGITDVNDNITRVGAQMNADPLEEAIFTVFALPIDNATDTGPLNLLVTIDYLVEFSEAKDITKS